MSDVYPPGSEPNIEGYLRGTFDVDRYLRSVQLAGQEAGFIVEHMYPKRVPYPILAMRRVCPNPKATLYLSAGMHGDEPAGSIALLRLLRNHPLPDELSYWIFPLLNPVGMALNQRENAAGLDINRDYKRFQTAEAKAHRKWLERHVERFDLAVLLHEDWESKGFYLYEVNPTCERSVADAILDAVRPVLNIDEDEQIDGHPADRGVIQPDKDSVEKHLPGDSYPEALWLVDHFTRHSYTLETPSNRDLLPRVKAHEAAVLNLIDALLTRSYWFDI